MKYKYNKEQDKIIFRAEDDLYVDTTRRQYQNNDGGDNANNQRYLSKGRRDNRINDPRANMTEKLWEEKFDILMKEDLIEVPYSYYEEQLLFKESSQLNAIFVEKENKNLFLIKKTQEIEGYLENEKEKEAKLIRIRQADLEVQQRALRDLES
jgi:hypothetical protein